LGKLSLLILLAFTKSGKNGYYVGYYIFHNFLAIK